MEECFNSLEDKSNSLEPPILACCLEWSSGSKSFDKLNFGVAEDQKSFNSASN